MTMSKKLFSGDPDGFEAREVFDKNYVGKAGLGLASTEMRHVEYEGFQVEFLVKGEDLIFHFFTKDGFLWTQEFRGDIWDAMLEQFRLQSRQDQLVIEWIQELYSWCVTVKKIAVVAPPDDEDILAALNKIAEPGEHVVRRDV